MPDTSAKITINLVPRKKIPFTERFLHWLLAVGRYIIIATELIVFVLFLSRFQLDAKFSDLSDKIKQEELIVKSLENVDKDARSLQIRISEIKRLTNGGETTVANLLTHIATLAPDTITLSTISLQEDKLTLNAISNSSRGFSLFVQNLRTSPRLRDISLGEISRDETTGGIKFALTAQIVKSEQKK